MNFYKTGAEAAQRMKQSKDNSSGGTSGGGAKDPRNITRFFLKSGEEKYVTFLTGDLTQDGYLSMMVYDEHTLRRGNDYKSTVHAVCRGDTGACDICNHYGKPSTVAAFLVIDHTQNTYEGKTYQNTVRLFIIKDAAFPSLQVEALRAQGLKGATVKVTRSHNQKSPRTGDGFQVVAKESYEAVLQRYGVDPASISPLQSYLPKYTDNELATKGYPLNGTQSQQGFQPPQQGFQPPQQGFQPPQQGFQPPQQGFQPPQQGFQPPQQGFQPPQQGFQPPQASNPFTSGVSAAFNQDTESLASKM